MRWFARCYLILSVPLVACGRGERAAGGLQTASVHDSAGIVLVDNAQPRWGTRPRVALSAEPVVDIGRAAAGDAQVLSGVTNAIVLDNGHIVIADGGSRRIRVYDRVGVHVRDFGGQGGGPGEFAMLGIVGRLRGDSIAAWDARAKRITVFDAAGHLGSVTTIEGLAGFVVPAVGWFEDGSVVVTPGVTVQDLMTAQPGERRPLKSFIRVGRDGTLDTLATVPGREQFARRQGSSASTQPVFFGRDSYAAVAGAAFFVGQSDVFAVQRRTMDGQIERIIRAAADARPVSTADLERLRQRNRATEQRMRRMAAAFGGAAGSQADAEPPHRSTHPFFDRLRVDARQHLWVRDRYDDGASPQRWHVFDADGEWLGTVTTPAALDITEIGTDYLIGIYHDDLDVEHVRLYRIIRGEPAEPSADP